MAQGKHLCHTNVYLLAEEDLGWDCWAGLAYIWLPLASSEVMIALNCCIKPIEGLSWHIDLASVPARRKVSGSPGLHRCRHRPLSPSIPALTTVKLRMKMRMRDTMRMRKLKGIGRTSSPPFPLELCRKERRSSMENTGTELVALPIHSTVSPVGLASFVLRIVWCN